MRFKEYKDGGKTSGDKKVYAYNYYLKKGVPAIQAAGIVGNLAAESAFDTTVVGKADSKGSQGIAQWHSERLNGLKKFAGNNWTNLDSQLDYVLHELNTTEKKAKNSLFSAKTPQEASLAFMNDYERPAEWAKRESGSKRVNESLKLLGLKPDPNYTYGSEEENNPYRFNEYKKTDYYAPQVSENISSLDNTQETTNLAEDKATEIKNRLEQKKAEKALLQQMILATQVAYVNPADYQSQPTFEEPQEEQMFQRGGIQQFKKQPFKLRDERGSTVTDNTRVNNYNNSRLFNPNVRNKTDKEIAQEREVRIQASVEAQKTPYTKENWRKQLAAETQATGDKLRVSNDPNFFDDYLNPAVMIGSMASNLGQAPLQAEQSDSILPYVTSIGAPLAAGALAGLGTQTSGQFVNNLANPLAGTGDLINNLGNKYLPNAYKLNPKAFTPSADKFYRQVDNTTYNEGLESGLIRGKQDVDMTQGENIINLNRSFGDDAYYNKDSLFYKDKKDLPYLFEANLPEESFIPKLNGRTRKLTTENTSVRVSKEPLSINDPSITTYKKDWLQGYKEVPKPSQVIPLAGTGNLMNSGFHNLQKQTVKSTLRDIRNSIDENIIYPFQFRKDIKEIKNLAKESPDYFSNPIVQNRVANLGINPNQFLTKPVEITTRTGVQSAYHGAPDAINIDLRNAKKWATEAGYEYTPKSIFEHEIGHRIQNTGSSLSPTILAEEVKGLILKHPSDMSLTKNTKTDIDYFVNTDIEKVPFLREFREGMIEKGVIKDKTSPITEENIENYLKVSKDRLSNILDISTPKNVKILKDVLNKLPSTVPIAGASYLATQNNNEFQQGGTAEVDNKWLQDWYQNRVIPNKDIQGAYLEDKPIYTERLKNIPPVTNVNTIDNNPIKTGQYQGDTGRLLMTPNAQPSVYTHEVNHYLNAFPSTMRTVHDNVVEQNMYKKGDSRLGANNENYEYFRNPDEIHSRVQVMRKDAGFKPNEEVTQDKLLNYLKDYKGNDENILQLMNLTDEKGLLEILNYMADNSENTKSNIMYAKNGGEKNSLWKNIRANRGSGKKPTKEMLEQERKINRKEDGGVIEDDRGQWAHPGEITKINSGNITMEGVSYPVYGVDNLGNSQMMYPGQNYQFPGTSVTEYPQNIKFQKGGNIPWYQDGDIFKKQWGEQPQNLFETLTKNPTSLNEQALLAGIPSGQGIYSGEGDDKTYISPDNILDEVKITPRKKIIQKEYKTALPEEYQEKYETTRDNIESYKIDFNRDKNFDKKELIKQLSSTDKKRELIANTEEKKLDKELQSQLLQMKGRRDDLDIIPEETKKIETRDLLSEGSVLQAQQKLKKLGYNLNPEGKFKNEGIDGKLGSITRQAIEQYNNNEIPLEQYKSFKDKKGFLGKCVEGQCSEYVQNEVFRNYKPNVSRQEWAEQTGLHGDAWDIGKNIVSAGGSEVKTDKVKAGDSVTMYTGGFSTYMNQAKAAGTDATHVGVVDKVNADGSYYILHNVHKLDPLSKVMSKVDPKHKAKYVGMEYRELVKDGKVQDGQNNSGFEIRNAYRPNYKNIRSSVKPITLRADTSLIPTKAVTPEIREASKDFINTINNQNNKKIIATKYGISENDYQSIAQATLGIIYQETKFGTSIKQLPKQIGATLAKAVGYKKDEVSKGAGQVKYKTNFGDTDITEFGITEDNFTEDKNTPLVIMSIVTPYYKNFIKAGETKENALYKAIEKYNRGSNTKYSKNLDVDYVNKVIEQGRNFEVQGKDKKLFNTTLHNLSSNKNLIVNNEKRKERELKNK